MKRNKNIIIEAQGHALLHKFYRTTQYFNLSNQKETQFLLDTLNLKRDETKLVIENLLYSNGLLRITRKYSDVIVSILNVGWLLADTHIREVL